MSTPLVEQKPFNGHTPGEVFVSDDAIVAREAPDDGGDIIASAPAGYEDSMRRWQDNAAFLAHCWNTYYQREAELQSMRERLSRMEEAGNAMAKQMKFWADYMGETDNQRGEEMVTKTMAAWDAAISNK